MPTCLPAFPSPSPCPDKSTVSTVVCPVSVVSSALTPSLLSSLSSSLFWVWFFLLNTHLCIYFAPSYFTHTCSLPSIYTMCVLAFSIVPLPAFLPFILHCPSSTHNLLCPLALAHTHTHPTLPLIHPHTTPHHHHCICILGCCGFLHAFLAPSQLAFTPTHLPCPMLPTGRWWPGRGALPA